MKLADGVLQDFEKHVLKDYPKEACGLVVDGKYHPCENLHPEPTKHFRISSEKLLLRPSAVLHSHPYRSLDRHTDGYRPEFPSASDIDHFNQTAVPWGIVATDGSGLSEMVWLDDNERPPLHGRLFIWGTQDCYSLVRDWFWQVKGINLYNVPREWGWWLKKDQPQLFEEYFAKAGFEIVPAPQVTIGDVALMRLGARHSPEVINHCGVISGTNELFHQGFGAWFSRPCRQDHWSKSIAKYIRYKN